MNAKKMPKRSLHWNAQLCVFKIPEPPTIFSKKCEKAPCIAWTGHDLLIHTCIQYAQKLPINAHGNLTCGARGLNLGLGLQIACMHAVIHLQFWAYGSLDLLLPISMSLSPERYFS